MKYRWIAALFCAAGLAAGCAYAPQQPAPTHTPANDMLALPDYVQQPMVQRESAPSVPDVVEKVSPAVVGLCVLSARPGETQLSEGIGTGFIVDEQGYIVTNHHVAGNAQGIQVVFQDGSQVTGERIWSDQALDLAVVKVEGGPYPTVGMGSSATLRVGDSVIAVGTPLTLQFQHTVTSGIISALRRTLSVPSDNYVAFMEELIQTNATINPGNSGGPLCDMNGDVIGINTLKVTQAEGIGFAIPMEVASPIVERIIRDGQYETPYIGLYVIDAQIARYYGQEVEAGLYVVNVDANGPMAALGIGAGDCITEIGGQPLDTVLALRCAVYAHTVGDTIGIKWVDEAGREHSEQVTLTQKPE